MSVCLLIRWLAYYINIAYIKHNFVQWESISISDFLNQTLSGSHFNEKYTRNWWTQCFHVTGFIWGQNHTIFSDFFFPCLSLPVLSYVMSSAWSCSRCFQSVQNSKQEMKPLLDLHCLFQYSISRDLELTKMLEIILPLFCPALHCPQKQTGL